MKRKYRVLRDMMVLMRCGHVTQVIDEEKKPICLICFPDEDDELRLCPLQMR